MPIRPPVHRPAGMRAPAEVARERKRHYDDRRGSARQRGYDTSWEKVRRLVLLDEPLCRFCAQRDMTVAATVVDHILSIRERPDLRLVRSNLRSLCQPCHDRRTATEQGFARPRGV